MHLYATAFGSVTPFCNRNTSNLMAYGPVVYREITGSCSSCCNCTSS